MRSESASKGSIDSGNLSLPVLNSTTLLDTPHALRTHELVSMAIQILKAIQHLHKYGIIHKDVATR